MKIVGKKQSIENSTITDSTIIQIAGVNTEQLDFMLRQIKNDNKLLNKLVAEKIEQCVDSFLHSNFLQHQKDIETVFNYKMQGICDESVQHIYYLKFMMELQLKHRESAEDCRDNLESPWKEEAAVLLDIIKKKDSECKLDDLRPETQAFALECLFTEGAYETIIRLQGERKTSDDSLLDKCWQYYGALSAFNTGDYKKAKNELEKIKVDPHHPKYEYFYYIASVYEIFSRGDSEEACDELRDISEALEQFLKRHPNMRQKEQELLLNARMNSALILGTDFFEKRYKILTDEEKKTDTAKGYEGIYWEEKGEFQKALGCFLTIGKSGEDWYVVHLMHCYIELEKWSEALQVYENAAEDIKNISGIKGMWLFALLHTRAEEFASELEVASEQYKEDVCQYVSIAYAARTSGDAFHRIIEPVLREKIEQIKKLTLTDIKFQYCEILAQNNCGDLCCSVLESIENLNSISKRDINILLKDIYDSERIAPIWKEKIANILVEKDVEKTGAMLLKLEALKQQKKYIGAIQLSQELYDKINDIALVHNMIAMVLESCPDRIAEYDKYVAVLAESGNPGSMVTAASAYAKMGKHSLAESSAYDALLMLNGKDDFEVYECFITVHNGLLNGKRREEIEPDIVNKGSAVELWGEEHTIIVCIEDPADYIWKSCENGCEAKHIDDTDSLYYKLSGHKVGEEVMVDSRKYVIRSIRNKHVYAFQYVLGKLESNPEKVKMPFKVFHASSVEEMIRQMEENIPVQDNTLLFDNYHMMGNELGLPVDAFCNGCYEKYINILRFLLYKEDQAFYAGEVCDISDTAVYKYVLTFPSLLILSEFGCLDLLEDIKENILIPQSLVIFLRDQLEAEKRLQAISPGSMQKTKNGELIMIKSDPSLINTWENLLKTVVDLKRCNITDRDILDFQFLDGFNLDQLRSGFKMSRNQIDAIVLAKREKAVYICDDLFLRRITSACGITGNSSMFLLKMLCKKDPVRGMELLKKVSKSNYIYIPMLQLSQVDFNEVWKNLLNGIYKKKYYGPILQLAIKNIFNKK